MSPLDFNTTDKPLTADEVRQRARAWYERQIAIISACHGHRWPEHQEWVEEHLSQKLRQRLLALGWRPRA